MLMGHDLPLMTVSIHFRLSPSLLRRLDGRAEDAGIGRTEAIRSALRAWCDQQDEAALRRREAERA